MHHFVDAVTERQRFKGFVRGIDGPQPDGFAVGFWGFGKRKGDVGMPKDSGKRLQHAGLALRRKGVWVPVENVRERKIRHAGSLGGG